MQSEGMRSPCPFPGLLGLVGLCRLVRHVRDVLQDYSWRSAYDALIAVGVRT